MKQYVVFSFLFLLCYCECLLNMGAVKRVVDFKLSNTFGCLDHLDTPVSFANSLVIADVEQV
jgi:hypothetical protein